ncbi:MAG: YIP1 family protein [Halobacteriales archaeon]
MTQWTDDPSGGRDRGPRAMARAWVEVLVRPRRFFRTGIGTGDQAPALTFVMAVVALEEASRVLLVENAVPAVAGGERSSIAVALAVAVLIVAPASLHLISALQTVLLMIGAPERGGVSETVQVLAYATAPCVFAGAPVPTLRAVCAVYGATLYVAGLSRVHDLSLPRAVVVGAVPAAVTFGYGFRGFDALIRLLGV